MEGCKWQPFQTNQRTDFQRIFFPLNIFKTKKNWLSFMSWMMVLTLSVFLLLFIFKYFSIQGLIIAFVYSMVVMGTHGTIWYHQLLHPWCL
jgi:hypothetical protein